MRCQHCGALRRCEGGIKVGGTLTARVVVGCPCSSLVRIPDDAVMNDDGLTDPTAPGNYLAQIVLARRFCADVAGTVTPELIEIECTNYDLSDLSTEMTLVVYDGYTGCIANPFHAALSTDFWSDLTPVIIEPFTTSIASGVWYFCNIFFNANNNVAPYVDPPIFNLKYEFVR
jgi:hypothetical protein